jgi:hypothetical protein
MEPKKFIALPLIGMVAGLPVANGIAEAHPCGVSGWDQCHALPPDEMPPNVPLYGQSSPTIAASTSQANET